MHDATPPPVPDPAAEGGVPERPAGFLTAAHIDRTLAAFRSYLEALAEPPPAPPVEPPAFDLSALVAQFTALRHDVNLQTKATRAATEQVQQLAAAPKPTAPDPADHTRPLLKAIIDIADTLAVAERQVNNARDTLEPLLAEAGGSPLPDPPDPTDVAPAGFFGKLFGGTKSPSQRLTNLQEWVRRAQDVDSTRTAAVNKLAALLAGVADGYAMSLRRVEKLLPAHGVEPIPTVGRPFDPELMEVIEAVGDSGRPSGTVVDEVRKGYRLNGQVFRYALVKVAR